uniref:Uncharacterized protein n=1 Tax=Gallus gallus TaxID=9031 RepID=A0A8V0ZGU0_CHICK
MQWLREVLVSSQPHISPLCFWHPRCCWRTGDTAGYEGHREEPGCSGSRVVTPQGNEEAAGRKQQ